jgi:multicomponent Na+:H+ antiporter subunit A
VPLALVACFASLVGPIAAGEVFTFSYAWVPSLGINLSFYIDGLSLLFALLISGIGVFIVIYAGGYLVGHPLLSRFYVYVLLFMFSMLGMVIAGNLITLFVFWELTSLSSYWLIGFDHERAEARAAALQALLVTSGGGLALLTGLLLLRLSGGSLELATLLGQGNIVRSHALYLPIVLLILVGAFTKSAQFPFHFWLPNAMEAPTPVSAYLHSATMVKAGVYLLARLNPTLGGTEVWQVAVTATGAATMLIGAYLAVHQTDLKRILAYSTVSALGTLILLIGVGTESAIKAAVVFLLAHALYKGALFLVAGALDHETGSRSVTQLGGLRRLMPVTALAAGLAALSMAGLPPFLGFIGKELLYEASLEAPYAAALLTGVMVPTHALLVAVAGIVSIQPFFGRKVIAPKKPHEAPLSLWLGPVLLAGLGLLLGLVPTGIAQALLSPAVSAVLAKPAMVKLALWHGLDPVLALSAVTVGLGGIAYLGRGTLRKVALWSSFATRWGPAWWYSLSVDGLNALARGQTRLLQNGYLRFYLLTVIATTVGLVGYTLVSWGLLAQVIRPSGMRFYEMVVAAIILLAAVAAVRSQSRLAAVAALGAVGYGVALIYILFSAPDLAMTQFAIETLTVILLVLVLYRLPRFARLSSTPARIRDLFVALAAGGLMTALILAVTAAPSHTRLTPYFAENSLPLAKGRNIVNVILVDFRALDTLGEITVLSVAAIGVYALLKLRLGKSGEGG